MYLVLDMINDLVHEEGPNGKSPLGEQVRSRDLIARTKAAIARARKAGLPIGYVRVGFSPDYKEAPASSPVFSKVRENGLMKLGTWGTEVHPELAPEAGDFDIVKHRVSPFYATNLEAILRVAGTRKLYVSGVSSNAVVQATVRDGHDRDLEMFVLEDCCAAFSADEHKAAIEGLARFGQAVDSTEVSFKR